MKWSITTKWNNRLTLFEEGITNSYYIFVNKYATGMMDTQD